MDKIMTDIEKFLDVYRVLTPEIKVSFEAQINASIKTHDPRTQKLYECLIQCAKDGLSTEKTIEKMKLIS